MNKADADRVFTQLTALGVATLSAEYSGSGDSGQFDGLIAYDSEHKYIESVVFDKPFGETEALQIIGQVTARLSGGKLQTFAEELEEMAWAAVSAAGHNGFWNNDGGYGKLVFDVRERTIVLEHSNYTGATEDSTDTVYSEDPNEVEEPAP